MFDLRRHVLTLLAFGLLLGLAVPAAADYASWFRKGKALQKTGKHQLALKGFDRALAFEKRPGASFFKALSLISLLRYREAALLLRQVAGDPKTPEAYKATVARRLKFVRSQLSRRVQLTVKVLGTPNARVLVGGRVVGKGSVRLTLAPGRYLISVRKTGFRSEKRSVVLLLEPKTVQIRLHVLPVRLRITVTPSKSVLITLNDRQPTPNELNLAVKPGRHLLKIVRKGYRTHRQWLQVEPGRAMTQHVELRKSTRRISTFRLVSYISFGVGAGLLVGAGVLHALALKDKNDAGSGDLGQKASVSRYDRAKQRMRGAWALYGIGGAVLINAITFLALDLNRKDDTPSVEFVPTHGGARVFVRIPLH